MRMLVTAAPGIDERSVRQRVAEGVTEAGLEGLDHEAGAELRDVLLGEGGALCNEHCLFLSAKSPLYDSWRYDRWLARRVC